MDSAVSTAARALSVGDALTALKAIALRGDAPALALRGIAMAQLGEFELARTLLRRAGKAFGDAEPAARARCTIAQAEIALTLRDLDGAIRGLEDAARLLARRGDHDNAAFAKLLQVRRWVLLGELNQAEHALRLLSVARSPARLQAHVALAAADVACRRLDSAAARRWLTRARSAAQAAGIPALLAEVTRAEQLLAAPAARVVRAGGAESLVSLSELEPVLRSTELIVDACRREVRRGARIVKLVRRPLLLELLVALARTAPSAAPREALIRRVFGAQRPNDSHRVRLRVEIARLRKLMLGLGRIEARDGGFVLAAQDGTSPLLLLPPAEGEASALLALLRDGDAWASSALATALATSQRAVQRALVELERNGKVRSSGRGRTQRWVAAPTDGFATSLLLVSPGALS